MRLPLMISVLALGLATPALAQATLTLDGGEAGGLSMSAPPNFDMSLDSGEPSSETTDLSLEAPPDESSSSEMSHMTQPPNFSSSEEELPSSEESSSEPPAGPPLASKDALQAFFDACAAVSSGDPIGFDKLNNSGWIPNEGSDTGPYSAIYSGYKVFDGYGEVDIWGSLQNFPTQRLGYCRIDLSDSEALVDFRDMNGLGGLKGKLEDRGDGNVFGTWETADKRLLAIGDRTDGALELEFNFLLGDAPKP